MEKIVEAINFAWGLPLTIFIIVAGIFFSWCIKFIQVRKMGKIIKSTFGKSKGKDNKSYRTIMTVLGGTVGAGNVAGVASAVAVGGPGAIFWMWIVALFSMATKMVEVSLAVKYHEKDENGNYVGGPMYYIRKLKGKIGKVIAVLYSIALLLYVLCDSGFVQINTVATALTDVFPIPLWIIGIVIIITSILLIAGGLKGISKVLQAFVPTMCVFYLIAALVVIFANVTAIPEALWTVVKYAFSPAPVVGGFLGATVSAAISKGAARGIFANEAGLGTSTTVHATSDNPPIEQGMWGIMEVAIVSFVVCTITALLVLTTGAWMTGADGAPMVLAAFESLFGTAGKYIMCIVIVSFAYTSYIGFYYEYSTCIRYMFKEKALKFLKWFYVVPAIIAIFMPIDFIWNVADLCVGFIIIPNIIALFLLNKEFRTMFNEDAPAILDGKKPKKTKKTKATA